MAMRLTENVIEWITGDKEVVCTFSQRKFINKIRKMMDKQPELVSKFHENQDGSICCRIPLKAVKLYLNTRDGSVFENIDDLEGEDEVEDDE